MASMTDPYIGVQMGDYRIVDLLGRGGMSRVYRGYDAKLDRYAAVKVIDPTLVAGDNDEEYRIRFQREARAIARLQHPNIVGVYQFGEYDSLLYMAMVFLEGRDLSQVLKERAARKTTLTHVEILKIAHDIAGALDYAHVGGVIHRDVKPSNIMLTTDRRAVLTDFGLALITHDGTVGNTFGSAHYIAPEQAVSSKHAVPQSDLYSLGVVLYQLLTGRVPFDDPSAMVVALQHISDPPPPPRSINANLPPAVERVLLKMLEKEPGDRYQNGEALVRALENALGVSTINMQYLPSVPNTNADTSADLPRQKGSSMARPVTGTDEGEGSSTLLFPPSKPSLNVPSSAPASPSNPNRRATGEAPSIAFDFDAPRRKSRTPWGVIAGVVVVAALIGGALLLAPTLTASLNVTPTAATAIAGALETTTEATAEETAAIIGAGTDEATPTTRPTEPPTQRPTRTPVVPTPTRAEVVALATSETMTDEAASPDPTATPTDAPTDEPTDEAPQSTEMVAAPADILLFYDDRTLVLLNTSTRNVNLGGLAFTRGDVTFRAQMWSSEDVYNLPPGGCFQLWTTESIQLPTPEACDVRYGWRAVGLRSRFWLSDDAEARFEVRRDETTLASCPVNTGECEVALGDA